jgi:DNA-directed RNA polymerase specialized sigma24 family protein
MKKREPPSEEDFNKLLFWLDPDRDKAAEKYQRIYLRVVRIFSAKGCAAAEELADETFDVVTRKVDWLIANYVGNPTLYFYGVAKKIYLEWLKTRIRPNPSPPPVPDNTEIELRCDCLQKCLQTVSEKERQMLLRYHEGAGRERIENRKRMADEFGITLNALRIQICHFQARLRPCIEECVRDSEQ